MKAEVLPVSLWFIPSGSEEGWAPSSCSGETVWGEEGRKQLVGVTLWDWWGDRLNPQAPGSEKGSINVLFFPLLSGTLLKTTILFARPVLIPVTIALIKHHGDWTSFPELLQKITSIWGLQTTEFYSLTALGTKVWNQDGSRAVLPPKTLRTNHSLSLWGSGGSWQSRFPWLVVASFQSLALSSLCLPFL